MLGFLNKPKPKPKPKPKAKPKPKPKPKPKITVKISINAINRKNIIQIILFFNFTFLIKSKNKI